MEEERNGWMDGWTDRSTNGYQFTCSIFQGFPSLTFLTPKAKYVTLGDMDDHHHPMNHPKPIQMLPKPQAAEHRNPGENCLWSQTLESEQGGTQGPPSPGHHFSLPSHSQDPILLGKEKRKASQLQPWKHLPTPPATRMSPAVARKTASGGPRMSHRPPICSPRAVFQGPASPSPSSSAKPRRPAQHEA